MDLAVKLNKKDKNTAQNKKHTPENIEYSQAYRETGTAVHCWWECEMVQPLQRICVGSSKT